MPNRAPAHRPLHARSALERNREHDRSRGSSRDRGYDAHWDKARAAYLRKHPLCVMCGRAGRFVPAAVIDHVMPHRGDRQMFWNEANWQPLCTSHHSSGKQRIERGLWREDVRTLFPLPSAGSSR